MSELGFTGKIPIPNLTQVGDLSGEVTKQQQIQLQSGALLAKQKAAKAKALADQQANAAAVQAQLGGLYENVHPFALPYVEQAAERLEADAKIFMQLDNGAELFKPYIEDFKASVTPLLLNQKMMERRGQLTAMIDPQSEEYKAADKQLGALYDVVANEDMVFAADNHQFRNLMQNVQLNYDRGRFTITGQEYDRKTGKVANNTTELSLVSMFNDPTEYQFGTSRTAFKTLEDIGVDLKNVDMTAARNSGWDPKRLTEKYVNMYSGFVDFDEMANTDNNEYAFRMAAYYATRDDILNRSKTARNFKTEEELLDYYELDPKKRISGDSALYDLVETALEEAWKTKTLPFTVWELTETTSRGAARVAILDSAEASAFAAVELPLDPSNQQVVSSLKYEQGKKLRSVSYPIEAVPGRQMETLYVTRVNPEYYDDLRYFLVKEKADGTPFATVDQGTGKVVFNPPNPADYAGGKLSLEYVQDEKEAMALTNMLAQEDFYGTYKVQGIRFYENNPNIYELQLEGSGGRYVIDKNDLGPYEQMAQTTVKVGLDKDGLTLAELYADAQTKFRLAVRSR
jgi:hypothetical protein